MAMVLKGYISENGELQIQLPPGYPPGEVEVSIELKPYPVPPVGVFKAKTGAEIIAFLEETNGWWDGEGIEDSVAWVEEVRRKQKENRNLPPW